jgi:hypothetical protein
LKWTNKDDRSENVNELALINAIISFKTSFAILFKSIIDKSFFVCCVLLRSVVVVLLQREKGKQELDPINQYKI